MRIDFASYDQTKFLRMIVSHYKTNNSYSYYNNTRLYK